MILPNFDLAQERFNDLQSILRSFYDGVKAGHIAHKDTNRGHDLAHDAQVALNCLAFAPDRRTGLLAFIAAFCHSMDYWGGYVMGDPEKSMANHRVFVLEALKQIPAESLNEDETKAIVEAATRHGEKNRNDQGLVQVVLQDADRIAILYVSTAFRIGRGYPDLPLVEPRDYPVLSPDSDYNNPWSCLNDFENCWEQFPPQFRTEGAQALAKQVFLPALEAFFSAVRLQHKDYGTIDLKL